MKRSMLAAVTAGAALAAVPSAAEAGVLAPAAPCVFSGQSVPLAGTGFTPATVVSVGGDAFTTALTDAAGSFPAGTTFVAPLNSSVAPKTITLTASDASGNPANVATAQVQVVQAPLVFDGKFAGKPRGVIRWRFAGYVSGRPIYGHFRFGGKTIRNYRFGTATGACGTLTVRARRLPVARIRYGKWRLQIDQHRTYSSTTKPRTGGTITIYKRFV